MGPKEVICILYLCFDVHTYDTQLWFTFYVNFTCCYVGCDEGCIAGIAVGISAGISMTVTLTVIVYIRYKKKSKGIILYAYTYIHVYLIYVATVQSKYNFTMSPVIMHTTHDTCKELLYATTWFCVLHIHILYIVTRVHA